MVKTKFRLTDRNTTIDVSARVFPKRSEVNYMLHATCYMLFSNGMRSQAEEKPDGKLNNSIPLSAPLL